MAIFGDVVVVGQHGDLYYIHKETLTDQVLNPLFAVLLAILAVVSVIGNPAVFVYNRNGRQNGAAVLFQILAVCDFLTNITLPFLVIPKLLNSEVPPIMVASTRAKEIFSVFFICLVSISAITTSLLSITRYLKIARPFIKLKIYPLIVYLVLNGVYVLVVLFRNIIFCGEGYYGTGKPYFLRFQQQSWRDSSSQWIFAVAVPYFVHCVLSLITSGLTVYRLRLTAQSMITENRAKSRQSSYAIVVMNIGNSVIFFLCIATLVIRVVRPDKLYLFLKMNFLKDILSPCLLSALNPVIFYSCCSDSRRKLLGSLNKTLTKVRGDRRRMDNSSSGGKKGLVVKNIVFGEGISVSSRREHDHNYSPDGRHLEMRPAAAVAADQGLEVRINTI